MSIRRDWQLPREHGAYGMLYVPYALGCFTARRFTMATLALGVAVTFFFFARAPLLNWCRARHARKDPGPAPRLSLLYLGIAGAALLPLFLLSRLWLLAPIGAVAIVLLAVNTWKSLHHEERSIPGELLAIAGLSLSAPAAYYATTATWPAEATGLWLLCNLYFASSVLYVKLRVVSAHERTPGDCDRMRIVCGVYHTAMAALLLAAVAIRSQQP